MEKINEYASAGHALNYLARADTFPHRSEGEGVLCDFVPRSVRRILDLGTGDGRLLALLRLDRPQAEGVALDFSPTMLQAVRQRFQGDGQIQVMDHNLEKPLPELGLFDAVVSSFAIHHCADDRKKQLYAEIFGVLQPGGIFCNLEHVSSATPWLHARFLEFMNCTEADEDPSNQLVNVGEQMGWLREIGYMEVDCYWKWMEMALFGGIKPR